jgi:hypothetical protein
MAMQRLRLAGRELDHHLREARGLVADGAVVQELGARAARRGEDLLLVVGRVDAPRAALLRLDVEAAQPARVRIVAVMPEENFGFGPAARTASGPRPR